VQLEPVLVNYLCQRNAVTGPLDLTGEATLRLPEPLSTLNGSGRLQIGAGRVIGPDLLNALGQALALTDLVSGVLAAVAAEPAGRGSPPTSTPSPRATRHQRVARTEDLSTRRVTCA
jgi:hypothetical protein